MSQNPFKIISNSEKSLTPLQTNPIEQRRRETQALFERAWLIQPEKFDPNRNYYQRTRLKRAWELLTKHVTLIQKNVVDIGCGTGIFTQLLCQANAKVLACDIASNALKSLKTLNLLNLELKQAFLPTTHFPDDAFDVVVCLDVIAELHPKDHRLAIAEISRLVKPDGWVLCSSGLDIYSERPLQQFLSLTETEFLWKEISLSYFAWAIKLYHACNYPQNFYQSYCKKEIRNQKLNQKKGFLYGWYYINTLPIIAHFWGAASYLLFPIRWLLKHNETVIQWLESFCKFAKEESGASHVILIGKRKPLQRFEANEESNRESFNRPPFIKERKWE